VEPILKNKSATDATAINSFYNDHYLAACLERNDRGCATVMAVAKKKYAMFHGIPAENVTDENLISSSAGTLGW
jgi:hypothetical protein